MSTQTPSRPVGVDELKRAWDAVNAGEFRTGAGAGKGPRGRGTAAADDWSPAAGEHTIAVIGSAGSVGASTVALAAGLAAAAPVRVIECCSVTASGLAAASTAELGLHPTDWRQGKRDHVLLERASEVLAGVDEIPLPTEAENETQLTILDIGWEAGQLLATDCWLAEAVRTADQLVLVTTATVPGMRRASGSPSSCWPTTGSPSRSPSPCAGRAARSGPGASSTPAAPPYVAPWTRTGAWRSPRTASSRSTAWTPGPSRPP